MNIASKHFTEVGVGGWCGWSSNHQHSEPCAVDENVLLHLKSKEGMIEYQTPVMLSNIRDFLHCDVHCCVTDTL